jgi:hypothetical protein
LLSYSAAKELSYVRAEIAKLATDQLPANLAEMVDGMLESAEEVYGSLQQAQDRPHVLDDYTVGRVRDVHTTQRNDLWLYEEQLARWQEAAPTPAQSTEIKRLQHQVDRLRSVLTSCLDLTDELKEGTIEKVLGKSDVEVAIDVLSGKRDGYV